MTMSQSYSTIGRSRGTDHSVVTFVPTSFEPQDVVKGELQQQWRWAFFFYSKKSLADPQKKDFEKFITINE